MPWNPKQWIWFPGSHIFIQVLTSTSLALVSYLCLPTRSFLHYRASLLENRLDKGAALCSHAQAEEFPLARDPAGSFSDVVSISWKLVSNIPASFQAERSLILSGRLLFSNFLLYWICSLFLFLSFIFIWIQPPWTSLQKRQHGNAFTYETKGNKQTAKGTIVYHCETSLVLECLDSLSNASSFFQCVFPTFPQALMTWNILDWWCSAYHHIHKSWWHCPGMCSLIQPCMEGSRFFPGICQAHCCLLGFSCSWSYFTSLLLFPA